jgi:hypothetical protein
MVESSSSSGGSSTLLEIVPRGGRDSDPVPVEIDRRSANS